MQSFTGEFYINKKTFAYGGHILYPATAHTTKIKLPSPTSRKKSKPQQQKQQKSEYFKS